MNIGNVIVFGDYKWRVLDVKDGKALLLTEEIIEQRDYHDKKENVTWEHSEIRKFLNGEFMERFCASDKERIVTTLNKNNDNPWYKSPGGNDTFDGVFL